MLIKLPLRDVALNLRFKKCFVVADCDYVDQILPAICKEKKFAPEIEEDK